MLNPKTIFKTKNSSPRSFTPTSEEMYVRNHLEVCGIKYKAEFKIENLNGDDKGYRVADFYLPNLKVYVEYFGMYNSTKMVRAEYDKKAKVYIKNGIPTIFIYPHELGFLEYAFHTKMLKLLRTKRFKNNRTTFRYLLGRYYNLGKPHLFFFSIFFAFLALIFLAKETGLTEDVNFMLYIIFTGAFGYNLVEFVRDITGYFFRDY